MRFTYKTTATLLMLLFTLVWSKSSAQENLTPLNDSIVESTLRADSLAMDSVYKNNITLSPDSSRAALKRQNTYTEAPTIKPFKPDPTKATWLAVVFPGGGQIYNRKYWKLPIVYGGFIGCLYAYNWNSQMYSDYRQAYLDIMDNNPNSDSYKDFFRPGYDFEANKDYVTEVFKKRKDRYRRWRDLSIFAFIGVYALSVIDAYVDAQLSSFDISEDINLTIQPELMNGIGTIGRADKGTYGLNCNITF